MIYLDFIRPNTVTISLYGIELGSFYNNYGIVNNNYLEDTVDFETLLVVTKDCISSIEVKCTMDLYKNKRKNIERLSTGVEFYISGIDKLLLYFNIKRIVPLRIRVYRTKSSY